MAAPLSWNVFADDLLPPSKECIYTPCYCEENVWMLCDCIRKNRPKELQSTYAVFISNNKKSVPIWHQKCSEPPDYVVVWDYHVILIHYQESLTRIYDLDTRLPFPCSLQLYASECLKLENHIKPEYCRLFRVIPAEVFLNQFSSNRSHMIKSDNSWIAPPPPYPCIHSQDSTNNIHDFISMDSSISYGEVFDLQSFLNKFSKTT